MVGLEVALDILALERKINKKSEIINASSGKTPTHSLKWTSIECICQLDTNYRYQFCLVWANVTWKNNWTIAPLWSIICFFRKASSLRPGVLELLRIKFDAWQTPCDILHLPFPSERYVQSLDTEWSDPTTPVAASRSLVEAPSECFHESNPYGSIETSSLVWKATASYCFENTVQSRSHFVKQ